MPQYVKCDYCHIEYDITGRLEQLEDDLEYIAAVNNFTSDMHYSKDYFHMHPSGTKPSERPEKNLIKENGMKEKAEKTKRYFMQLNTRQRKNMETRTIF